MLLSPAYAPFSSSSSSSSSSYPLPALSSVLPGMQSLSLASTPSTSSGSLPSRSFWGKYKTKTNESDSPQRPAQMALQRQPLLTLAYGDMETIRMVRAVFTLSISCVLISFSVRWQLPNNFAVRSMFSFTAVVRGRLMGSIGPRRPCERLDETAARCDLLPPCSGRIRFPTRCGVFSSLIYDLRRRLNVA